MGLLKGYTKEEKSWMMYDWANSAHSVIIVTILPIFYNTVAGFTKNATNSMSTWAFCTSFAMLIVAILSPFLGAIGDYKGYRKKFFIGFMLLGVAACALLAFTPFTGFEDTETAQKVGLLILVLYIVSQVGFSGANVYYDSFLPDVTTQERMDKVSTMGFGLGYIGGSTIPLAVFLVLNVIGVPMLICLSVAFGFTAIWWFVFSLPLIKNVEQKSYTEKQKNPFIQIMKQLKGTVSDIFKHKAMFVFLLAYFFYIDGVNTIIHMSTSYGDTLGLNQTQMMLALLLVQMLGLPFAMVYMKLSEKFGARTMIGVGILIYMGICVFGFFVREEWHFWVLAILVATSQGGIQALSRSMFGKMITDKSRSGEYFGFYDIFGKFSAIMGPTVFGFATVFATNLLKAKNNVGETASPEVLEEISKQAAPWGVLSVLLIFLVGGFLYFFVLPKFLKKEQGK